MLSKITVVALLLFLCPMIMAQKKLLTIDDLYDPEEKVDFDGSPPRIKWLPDGEHYLLTKRGGDKEEPRLSKVHAATGQSNPFYDVKKMEVVLSRIPDISRQEVKELTRKRHLMDPHYTAALIEYKGDLFYYHLSRNSLTRITDTPQKEREPSFSPDGTKVAFIRDYDLHVVEIAGGRERALTSGGNEKLRNGYLDWVYQEEIYGRGNFKGYWWSPDSRHIAFLQLDESPVKTFTIVDHIPYRLEVEEQSYPKAGDPNPKVKLGVVSVGDGNPVWIDERRDEEFLIVRVGWSPDSNRVVYQVQDREQTWLELLAADIETRSPKRILREDSPAWVNVNGDPHWLEDGSFLWLSERLGWKHIYHYGADGKLRRPVTSGKWEVRRIYGVDEKERRIFFGATEHSPIALHTYSVGYDGSDFTRLTRREGTHRSLFNKKCSHYVDYWSDVGTPTQTRLYDADGSLVRTIDDNEVQVLKEYRLGKHSFHQVETADGFAMEALMIQPPDFDPGKKYPVMCYTYGGPHAPQVRNAWQGTRLLWHHLLAQRGYLIWICDNRTASGKGVFSTWQVYRKFGKLELEDIEQGLAWLKQKPYVDSSRIGIWGWSFGGYMTCYALTHSTQFKIGIAGAPVTDWRDYDTIYTERYMTRPQNNAEGYDKSSVVEAAENLHGKLLLIHGTIDDNVHMQNTLQFVYALQKAGKQFRLMLYPRSRHGIRDPVQTKHLRTMMADFILDNL